MKERRRVLMRSAQSGGASKASKTSLCPLLNPGVWDSRQDPAAAQRLADLIWDRQSFSRRAPSLNREHRKLSNRVAAPQVPRRETDSLHTMDVLEQDG